MAELEAAGCMKFEEIRFARAATLYEYSQDMLWPACIVG